MAAIGGLLWDGEKELLRRGIAVLRTVWEASGAVSIDYDGRSDKPHAPTVYLVPDGETGDAALDAIASDYERAAPGIRRWLPSLGEWVDSTDLDRINEDLSNLRDGSNRD